jgi:pyruvate ferredoxin oxidoreductase alpha subunit
MNNSIQKIYQVDQEFGDRFGRYYGGMVDEYRCDDAEVILVTVGSVSGTVRLVVDKMRKQGYPVGMLKLRYLRPFPQEEILKVVKKVKAIGVIDRDISFGYEGTVFTNVNSTLTQLEQPPLSVNYIAGLGGRDISKEDIENMFLNLYEGLAGKPLERVQFVKLEVE